MSRERDNVEFVRFAQKSMGIPVDGWAGRETRRAFTALVDQVRPGPSSPWPEDNEEALIEFYGQRGENLIHIPTPYEMRLAWNLDVTTNRILVNERCAESLARILRNILEFYGSPAEVAAARMDRFGGCFNNRRMRFGRKWSRHAWACAIDLNPTENRLYDPWPGTATMPVDVIKLFEAEGWKSLAREIGRDAMHFQATR